MIFLLLLAVIVILFVAYGRSDNECPRNTATPTSPMKAIVYCDYGAPDVLHLQEIEKPVPNDNQVLLKVRAASLNPYEWHFMRGTPYVMRLEAGLRKPKSVRIGGDVAGVVESVGRNVTQFKPGDEVFGLCQGSLAEYCLAKSKLVAKPAELSFADAAAIPVAGITALQGLRDNGKIVAGQKVLINGASGGVGTFAVQLAKSLGAEVTGVCSGRNAEMVRGLGADQVIDYTKADFTRSGQHYDLILDCVGTQPLSGFRRVLTPHGRCVLIGGGGPNEGNWIGPMSRPIKALLLSPFVSQKFEMLLADVNPTDLAALRDLIQAGKMKSVIDRHYPLREAQAAMRYLEEGHARGKVGIDVE